MTRLEIEVCVLAVEAGIAVMVLVWIGFSLLNFRKEISIMADNQEGQLQSALVDLKAAIGGVGDRVTAKLDALAAANPDLTDEINDIRSDIDTLNGIAADAVPAAAPAPTGTVSEPPTTETSAPDAGVPSSASPSSVASGDSGVDNG